MSDTDVVSPPPVVSPAPQEEDTRHQEELMKEIEDQEKELAEQQRKLEVSSYFPLSIDFHVTSFTFCLCLL